MASLTINENNVFVLNEARLACTDSIKILTHTHRERDRDMSLSEIKYGHD